LIRCHDTGAALFQPAYICSYFMPETRQQVHYYDILYFFENADKFIAGMLTAVYEKEGIGRIFIKNFWRIWYKMEEKGGALFCREKRVLCNFKLTIKCSF
jgi:hypothetical protein